MKSTLVCSKSFILRCAPIGDAEIAPAYDVHPVSLSKWKRQFLDSGAEIFSGNDTVKTYESRLSDLEKLLGQKEVELALLKKILGNR